MPTQPPLHSGRSFAYEWEEHAGDLEARVTNLEGGGGGSGLTVRSTKVPYTSTGLASTAGVELFTLVEGEALGIVSWSIRTAFPASLDGTMNPYVQVGTPPQLAASSSFVTSPVFNADNHMPTDPVIHANNGSNFNFSLWATAATALHVRLVGMSIADGSTNPWPDPLTAGEVWFWLVSAPGVVV